LFIYNIKPMKYFLKELNVCCDSINTLIILTFKIIKGDTVSHRKVKGSHNQRTELVAHSKFPKVRPTKGENVRYVVAW